MPALGRKRQAPAPLSDDGSGSASDRGPRSPPQPQGRRPRESMADDDSRTDPAPVGDDSHADGASSTVQMVKKMVRLALACEYARQPIRRADIGLKVLGSHGRQFKLVFAAAQKELRDKLGMKMVELPMREKVTISQRRAAQRMDRASTTSKAWILTSILPARYRTDDGIVPPPRVPTAQTEATYVGLYTLIVAVIYLGGGTIAESKLERYLKRTNADHFTPIDKTDKLLLRMCREGYLVKIKDSGGGEEVVEYMVGPRGKVEVGTEGVAGLVRSVYGDDAVDDLEARVQRSLGLEAASGAKRARGDHGAGARPDGDEDEEAEEEEEEEEDDEGGGSER
ncbi:MAG: hypothetical protein M1826_001471 [Phylliscum demangeonii]|nr:MAG: hypothetical protein M1826_001471 [Phylliscum demangeonii]